MGEAMRHVKDVKLGDHLCLAFSHEDEQREVVSAFVSAGLERRQRVLYFTDGPVSERVRHWLEDAGIDVTSAMRAGRLDIVSSDDGYLASGRFDADLSLMRRRVSAWAVASGLSGEQAERLLLAVNEVVTNAVEHGGGHGEIRLWADGPAIGCDGTDPGHLDTPFPGYLPPGLADARGLWVVRQICDLVEIRAGRSGTQVRLRLSRT